MGCPKGAWEAKRRAEGKDEIWHETFATPPTMSHRKAKKARKFLKSKGLDPKHPNVKPLYKALKRA